MRKFNKLILFIICLVLSVSLFSCGKDNLTWTNETAVYAYIKDEYKEEVLKDLDKAFKSFMKFSKSLSGIVTPISSK